MERRIGSIAVHAAALLAALVLLCTLLPPGTAVNAAGAQAKPEIDRGPSNYMIYEGGDLKYSVEAKGSNLSFAWYITYGGTDYPLSVTPETVNAPWREYTDSVEFSVDSTGKIGRCVLHNVKKPLEGSKVYCVAYNNNGCDVSLPATVSISGSPEQELDYSEFSVKNRVNIYSGALVKIAVKVDIETGCEYHYRWYETKSGRIENIQALLDYGDLDSSVFIPETLDPGTYYYVCAVEKSKGSLKNISYSAVIRVNITEENTDSPFVSELEITSKPKQNYKVGDTVDLNGIAVRAYAENGFVDIGGGAAPERLKVYPNNIYSTEQRWVAVEYEGRSALLPVNVTASSSTGFKLEAVSEQNYVTYIPKESFQLEAKAVNAGGSVSFKWYRSTSEGVRGAFVTNGSQLKFPSGLSVSDVNITYYYLCVGTCDGKEAELLFTATLRAPDSPEDTPTPDAPVATDVPAATPSPSPAPGTDTNTAPAVNTEPPTAAPTEAPAVTEGPGEATEAAPADATEAAPADATDGEPADGEPSDEPEATSANSGTHKKLVVNVGPAIAIGAGSIGLAVVIAIIIGVVSKKKK